MKALNVRSFIVGFALAGVGAFPHAQTPPSHPPGIFLDAPGAADAKRVPGKMVRDIKQTGTAKMMLTQGHAKGAILAFLPGAASDTRASSGAVTFAFYFSPQTSANPGGLPPNLFDPDTAMRMATGDFMPTTAKSAEEFALVRLTVTKDNKRQAEVGNGGKGAKPSKDSIPLAVESIGPNAFRVQPRAPLEPGEYAFYFVEGSGGQLWDFGVDAK